MGKRNNQKNQQQRQQTAPYPGPNSQQTSSSSSNKNTQQGTSANRSAKSPNPTKRVKATHDNSLSSKQQGKRQEVDEPTGIDLDNRLINLTYGPSTNTTPPDASKNASQTQVPPETPIQEVTMQDVDPIPEKEQEVTLTIIEKPKSLFAAILMDSVKGKTRSSKIDVLKKIFFPLTSFVAVKQRELKKVKYLAIELLNQEDLQLA